MDTFEIDAAVVGAGAVGLACARRLALSGLDVLVLEAASGIATETSSRNSEVVHAGLYYPTGSLKARLCVAGRRLLYAYCDARGVRTQRCGKLVVAVGEAERAPLEALLARSNANGVEEVELLSGDEARRMEPALSPDIVGAVYSGTSGIFDSHGYFLALQGEIEDRGGSLAFESPVTVGRVTPAGIEVETGGASPARIRARLLVNAAGHGALALSRRIVGAPDYPDVRMHWAKGNYFNVAGRGVFSRLIYPMHTSASLGLHLTVDLGGGMRLGPDVEWLPNDAGPPFDYRVDPARAEVFYGEVRRYWPGLKDGSISPAYAGVRPKLVPRGHPPGDFVLDGPEGHGVPGLINLIGIESPGLTSSLAIANEVAARLGVET